jgi:glycosyltransferase involved in cell wall biosynthesis
MKVALVSFDIGEYCVRLASAIAEDPNTRIILFLPDCEANPHLHLLHKSVELHIFKKPRLRQPVKQLRMVTRLVSRIRKFNPDVTHLQMGHLWFNWALPMLGEKPLVLTVHDSMIHIGDKDSGKTPQWVFDRACYRARERIVHVPQVKESLLQRLQIPGSTVHVVPHILLGDDTAAQGVEEEQSQILFFGRIWEYKGLEYLIRAEPLVTARFPEAKFVIAGTGEDMNRYRRMMVHPEQFIVHNEYISDEKRAELFRRASIVALPYIEASQSGVIPLARCFGKPVVATTVGGLPAQVEDGKTGFLVPPRDEVALADALVRLLNNRDLRIQFGRNGKRKLVAEASPKVIAQDTLAVYRLAIDSRSQLRNYKQSFA